MFSSRIPSKADIRLIRSLGQKKFREELGMFVAEGEKLVEEALRQDRFEVIALYRTEEAGTELMSRMSHLASPSPSLAVLRIPENRSHNTASPLPSGLCLALDSVRDPGNMGTILRMADWFGIRTVYLSPDCVDIYNPKTVQATMGSIFRQNTCICNLAELVRDSREAGIPVYATTLNGDDIRSTELNTSDALILMGSERDGLSCELVQGSTCRLHIPSFDMEGDIRHTDTGNTSDSAESLNVAIATAVICYEFRRRKQKSRTFID